MSIEAVQSAFNALNGVFEGGGAHFTPPPPQPNPEGEGLPPEGEWNNDTPPDNNNFPNNPGPNRLAGGEAEETPPNTGGAGMPGPNPGDTRETYPDWWDFSIVRNNAQGTDPDNTPPGGTGGTPGTPSTLNELTPPNTLTPPSTPSGASADFNRDYNAQYDFNYRYTMAALEAGIPVSVPPVVLPGALDGYYMALRDYKAAQGAVIRAT